ncbi:2-amino-4-hydroxy-6-hydroxymethyldihydropteridine diphosphokinase [Ammoniphilus oxalaticus]|uniref:2-amino-4-hydroxy-6-hydroxymethyldihydropteridine diphosphokinase n=1 Tax=Ammoniphilus oxalaticus TaxID=66863 RepID=A0A419SG58_9BACL|nr:2-amino-4-hydroxy-6-hydroxymethyldihydropteridine diphosphokinase [Ammoniphilus oxalaticus]RKD22772.1 2-amino-4-hydroxy-6-hydroxymethyldihydropteridine diphosphokinase [Ammoniphilus oxalaticus]
MVPYYISLGSNVGERFYFLQQALESLQKFDGVEVNAISNVYETDPVGLVDQPSFLNCVAGGKTRLSADELLAAALRIEQELGRVREIRWGPRTIDIDILTYGLERRDEEHLQIPHPRMRERAFVMIPFAEIAPTQLIAVGNELKTTVEMLENVNDKSGVRKWKDINWETELGHFEN